MIAAGFSLYFIGHILEMKGVNKLINNLPNDKSQSKIGGYLDRIYEKDQKKHLKKNLSFNNFGIKPGISQWFKLAGIAFLFIGLVNLYLLGEYGYFLS